MSMSETTVEVTCNDLPLFCPGDKSPVSAAGSFGGHPRVFLPVEKTGEARCPYCGTLYRLKEGERCGGAH